MSAEMAEPGGGSRTRASFGSQLAVAGTAVADLAGAAGELSGVADEDVAGVMRELTTLVGQLDGLRVEVARVVRQRGLYRLRGARDVCGWLRADARTADDASKFSRLAAMASGLPRITGLLAEGSVSLARAGAADAQERAGEEYDDFAKRAVRISCSLGGAGEVSGRLHAEAAEQVIAAFEELGAKAGPDDKRTKAQRWADVLTRLVGLAGQALADCPGAPADGGLPAESEDDQPGSAEGHAHDGPAGEHDHDGAAEGHDHDGAAGRHHDHDGPAGRVHDRLTA